MLGIILTGHGGFASGLEQAMKQILGEQPQFIAIDFPETSSTARLTAQLEQAVSAISFLPGSRATPGKTSLPCRQPIWSRTRWTTSALRIRCC